jgi:glucose/arabinose dehydrogenase
MKRLLILFLFPLNLFAQLPEGFELEVLVDMGTDAPMGTAFVNDSTFFTWTCNGFVFLIQNGEKIEPPVLDISDEVGCWGDNGMLGMALDPNFQNNGYMYLLYQVDTYHLFNADSANYDPFFSIAYDGSIGRVTRYTVNTDDFTSADEASRHILIGEQIEDGLPVLTSSHSVGSLEFGSDGSLLLTMGDGNTWWGEHNGGSPYPNFCYDSLGLATGIINLDEDVGAFRSQHLDSYNGKLLRFDPETGLGLPSNPYYDALNPESPRSKVWAMGLRNPFRMTRKPNTGSTNMQAGDPGTFYIGEVGFSTWEEINVVNGPAYNFGWPIYEGMDKHPAYSEMLTENILESNPAYDDVTCPAQYYQYQNLLVQENQQHDYTWSNPCDALIEIPDSVITFSHTRPVLSYQNTVNADDTKTVVPGYDENGNAIAIPIVDVEEIEGEPFTGLAGLGGDFYHGTAFPEEYFGTYFQTDYSGWTRAFWFSEADELEKVELFSNDLGLVVHTNFNPYDECLYFCSVSPVEVKRVCYTDNVRPIVTAIADTMYGASPLLVNLDGSESYDPDEDPLTYEWVFGDGETSDEISPQHVFTAPDSEPFMINVQLNVTDTAGNIGQDQLVISLNNTPPDVEITGISEGQLYSIHTSNQLDFSADVQDSEHSNDELDFRWELYLHHNTHFHLVDTREIENDLLDMDGIGCEETADYYYRVKLKVDDPAGLSNTDEKFLYPDCDELPPGEATLDDYILYPNPSDGLFSIRGPLQADETYTVYLYTIDGKKVYEKETVVSDELRIGVFFQDYASRVLFLRLEGPDTSWTSKVLLYQD